MVADIDNTQGASLTWHTTALIVSKRAGADAQVGHEKERGGAWSAGLISSKWRGRGLSVLMDGVANNARGPLTRGDVEDAGGPLSRWEVVDVADKGQQHRCGRPLGQ